MVPPVLRVLFRDDLVLVADKPAGVLTVPGRGEDGPSLIDEVRLEAPGALPVHRLDRDTSGVVVFALTRDSHRALNAVFEGRKAEKSYLALAKGDLEKKRRVDLPLSEGRKGQMRVASEAVKKPLAALTEVIP